MCHKKFEVLSSKFGEQRTKTRGTMDDRPARAELGRWTRGAMTCDRLKTTFFDTSSFFFILVFYPIPHNPFPSACFSLLLSSISRYGTPKACCVNQGEAEDSNGHFYDVLTYDEGKYGHNAKKGDSNKNATINEGRKAVADKNP